MLRALGTPPATKLIGFEHSGFCSLAALASHDEGTQSPVTEQYGKLFARQLPTAPFEVKQTSSKNADDELDHAKQAPTTINTLVVSASSETAIFPAVSIRNPRQSATAMTILQARKGCERNAYAVSFFGAVTRNRSHPGAVHFLNSIWKRE
jgi:hypothetical protein